MECELGEFECTFGGQCIPKDQLCDGVSQCLLQNGTDVGEDEQNCDFIYS